MRAPGMNLPVTNMFATTLSAGPSVEPVYLDGAIGSSFLTPAQDAWNDGRKKFGSLDDPDAGGYDLRQIDWDKDNGSAEMTTLEATGDGWYAPWSRVKCHCAETGPCGCQ
jgi:hypothetical protein